MAGIRAGRKISSRFCLTCPSIFGIGIYRMVNCSTREAAKKLGIGLMTIQRYIADRKIRAPKLSRVGGVRVRLWSTTDIERVRKQLPKIANGRRKKKKAKK